MADKKQVRRRGGARVGRQRQAVIRRRLTYAGLLAAAILLEALRRAYSNE